MITDDDVRTASRSQYCLGYRELLTEADFVQISRYCEDAREKFTPIAKTFTPEANSRWLLRHYLAIKFVSAAALLAGSAQFSFNKNLLLAVPYFNYYALLNACRALVLTSPRTTWDGANTIEMTHEKTLNLTADYMRELDPKRRAQWREHMARLRNERELYSYRFPLSGPDFIGRDRLDPAAAIALTRLVAELAHLNTECFEAVLAKHVGDEMPVVELQDHDWAAAYKIVGGASEIDHADRYRFLRLRTGWRTVSPLELMISEGLMDDLYGSWCGEDAEGDFNPDDYQGLILRL